MQERVLSFCLQHRLFSPGEKVMVAVSGGADSVALLSILCELRERLNITLLVVHVNHGFRGAESDADADFVVSLCQHWSLPCLVRTLDIPTLLAEQGGSAQEVSRRERLMFYREVAGREGITTVALGHHQDDQAETVLLHLLRGSGAGGLSGMSPVTSVCGLRLARPLLKEQRAGLEAYLQGASLSYRTDSSNARDYYARNLLRNQAMPLLKSISPRAVDAITRTAELLADDDACLNQLTELLWASGATSDGYSVTLRTEVFAAAHIALQRRMVRRAWVTLCGDSADLDAVHVEYVTGLLAKQRGRMIELPRDVLALRERDSIILT
ncbi:MAG TPA: tRNA lysidine(34) synthetase TilS, partial [Bacillota bacterium]|nr:tRNA lysidine(34) synthetase TilS [Bacillota bacterium]